MDSLKFSTTAAAVDGEDSTRARAAEATGAVDAAVLAVEASSVDVDAAAAVTSVVAVVASVVLLAASRLRRSATQTSLSLSFWVLWGARSLHLLGWPTHLTSHLSI